MINEQRVQRIRTVIYACLLLIVLVPIVLMLVVSIKTLGVLSDLNAYLASNPLASSAQTPENADGGQGASDPDGISLQPQEDATPGQQAKTEKEEPLQEVLPAGDRENQPSGTETAGDENQGRYVANTYLPDFRPHLYFDTLPQFDSHIPQTIYLTIDNTPAHRADEILRVLDKHDVNATFFVWWNDSMGAENYDFYRRLLADGHQIGIHFSSNSLSFSEMYASSAAFLEQFDLMFQTLLAETGAKPRLYRLPGGSVTRQNPERQAVLQEIKTELDARGFLQYDWTASGQDAVPYILTKDQVLRNVKNTMGQQNNPVVLLHDGTSSDATVQALDALIQEYKTLGYRFEVLQEHTRPTSFLSHTNRATE